MRETLAPMRTWRNVVKQQELYTTQDTTPKNIKRIYKKGSKKQLLSNDQMLAKLLLEKSIGQIIQQAEKSTSPREFFLCILIRDAIMELDVGTIEQIIKRVDGTPPDERERDQYSNLVGDALDDIMSYDDLYQVGVYRPDDPTIIALAKALFIISVRRCGKDPQKRRDRAKAMEIIFQRTGGRKNRPTKQVTERRFVDPDWMAPLPEGGDNGQ